jgi:serine protease inhibitor
MMHESYKRDVRYAAFNADGSFFPTPSEVPAGRDPDPKTVYPGKNGFVMLELPYKGGDLSMVAIVPQDAGGLEELETKLSGDALQNWIGKLQRRAVHVYLPKFKLETEYPMKPTLVAMGMIRAFDNPGFPDGAQFEGMCASQDPEQRLFLAEVIHKAFVEVSEKGTEAAAATAILAPAAADEPEPATVPFTPTFRADKPFLFLIRDIKTGTVLFLGRMVRPPE